MGRACEKQKQNYSSGSGSERCGVGAQIAGLPALKNHSGHAGDAGEKQGNACEQKIDSAQYEFRKSQYRLDDHSGVNLVDVILVQEQLVAGWERGGNLRGTFRLAAVVFVGDQPAFKGDEDGSNAEQQFEGRIAGGHGTMRGSNRSKIGAETLDTDPASADKKDTQNHKRDEHGERRGVMVLDFATRLAHEGHVPKSKHVERRDQRRDEADQPQEISDGSLKKCCVKNGVFGEEARERWKPGDGDNGRG